MLGGHTLHANSFTDLGVISHKSLSGLQTPPSQWINVVANYQYAGNHARRHALHKEYLMLSERPTKGHPLTPKSQLTCSQYGASALAWPPTLWNGKPSAHHSEFQSISPIHRSNLIWYDPPSRGSYAINAKDTYFLLDDLTQTRYDGQPCAKLWHSLHMVCHADTDRLMRG